MRSRVLVLTCLASLACGGPSSGPTSPTQPGETLELRRQTAHFRILAGQAPDAAVVAAAEGLEAHYARVLSDLGVGDVAMVTVKIWQDEATYFSVLEGYFGERYQATGYITGRDEIRVLAVPQLPVNVVHEFCHIVSLYVNPSIANNPRWYWETIALYENGELVQPRTLDYMVRGAYPTLHQLNAGPNASRQVYEIGYLLGEFIVSRWGRPAFVRLIQTNADLPATLGLSAPALEEAWYVWVRERYLR